MPTLAITHGPVSKVTLNRPEVRNAFNDEVITELTQAFTELGKSSLVRVIVLAAQGPAFCAGADLNWMRRMADYTQAENLTDAATMAEMLRVIYTCPKPTIARIQGDVYAGGIGLVAACDMAVSVDSANELLTAWPSTGATNERAITAAVPFFWPRSRSARRVSPFIVTVTASGTVPCATPDSSGSCSLARTAASLRNTMPLG